MKRLKDLWRKICKRMPDASTKDRLLFAAQLMLGCVFIAALILLTVYLLRYFQTKGEQEELRAVYYAEETVPPGTPGETSLPEAAALSGTPDPTSLQEITETGEPVPEETPIPGETAEPEEKPTDTREPEAEQTEVSTLSPVTYPMNPHLVVDSAIERLKKQNSDIIGWLEIPELLETAVVQRDNTYYLDRDYQDLHNYNGAIFLDADADLSTRPYLLMLFGHNMKSGAMFGFLHRYSESYYYKLHAFISFTSQYEAGKYVIFAAGIVDSDIVDIYGLYSMNVGEREKVILQLKECSDISVPVDVRPDDQILMLVTCVNDSDNERRIVTARRLRDDESEESLRPVVRTAENSK